MKRYLQTAVALLRKPKPFMTGLPEPVDGRFWTVFMVLTFVVAQVGVFIDIVVISGQGMVRFAGALVQNAVFYALMPLWLHALARLFRGKGSWTHSLRIVSAAFCANLLALLISPALALVRQSGMLKRGADGDLQQSFFIAFLMLFYMTYLYAGRLLGAYYAGMEKDHGLGFFKSTLAGALALLLSAAVMGVGLAVM